MKSQIPFIFEEDAASESAAVCIILPSNIKSKEALLAMLATQFNFPDYFGENWDAFDECIRDLSWLPIGEVKVKHADVPLANDVRNAKIYLEILRGAVRDMSKSDVHPLSVVFPTKSRD